jgi:hypothetical protein
MISPSISRPGQSLRGGILMVGVGAKVGVAAGVRVGVEVGLGVGVGVDVRVGVGEGVGVDSGWVQAASSTRVMTLIESQRMNASAVS